SDARAHLSQRLPERMARCGAVATTTNPANFLKAPVLWKYASRHWLQKYTITANIVPVWSMTKSNVIAGEEGSRPSNFSTTTTWAELETGNSSASPWTKARIRIYKICIHEF